MSEYIDKQKTLNLIFEISENVINSLPSADVVEVVRCKDCKYGQYDMFDRGMYCGRKNVELDTYEEDFCSYGERKDG